MLRKPISFRCQKNLTTQGFDQEMKYNRINRKSEGL